MGPYGLGRSYTSAQRIESFAAAATYKALIEGDDRVVTDGSKTPQKVFSNPRDLGRTRWLGTLV
jgi:hypothetical protein